MILDFRFFVYKNTKRIRRERVEMKKIVKITSTMMVAFVLFFGVISNSNIVQAQAASYGSEQIPGGYIYGPFYQTIKGSDLGGLSDLNRLAKKAVLNKYGKIDKKKSYRISYRNKVMTAHLYSQKGTIVDVKCLN